MCKNCVFCDSCVTHATLCGDRRGRGAKAAYFCDSCVTHANLCGDRHGRCAKTVFFAILAAHARPSAGIGVVEMQKLRACFLRLLLRARDPLRESAWSMSTKDFCGIELARATLCANRGGRCVVAARFLCDSCCARAALCGGRRGRDAKTAGVFWNFQLGRATLCGDRACRIALAMVPCESSRFARDPLRGLRVLDRSRLTLPGLRAIVRWDQAAKSQPFKTKVVREVRPGSSGSKVVTF